MSIDSTTPDNKSGFLVRHDPSLTIVKDWAAFVAWGHEGGYDESYFDVNDEKCLALQERFNEELADQALEDASVLAPRSTDA